MNSKAIVSVPKFGDVIVRGRDWDWGDQDCNKQGKQTTGLVMANSDSKSSWVIVQWDFQKLSPFFNAYRIGLNGKYDLYYAEYSDTIIDDSILMDIFDMLCNE